MKRNEHELLEELVMESRDHLASIEPDLLVLEKDIAEAGEDLINRVFRAIHSIKGGFSFFGIEHVTRLSHAMENVLSRIRDKELAISTEVADALFQGIDRLRVLLDDVHAADSIDITGPLGHLQPYLSAGIPPAAAGALAPRGGEENLVLPDEVRTRVVYEGKHLYRIQVLPEHLRQKKAVALKSVLEEWSKFGEIIATSAGDAVPDLPVVIGFSTPLEPDLIGTATGIEQEYIESVDLSDVRERLRKEKSGAVSPEDGPGKKKGVEHRVEEALRVRVGLLDSLMNLAGELVLGRNQLFQSLQRTLTQTSNGEKAVNLIFDEIRKLTVQNAVQLADQDLQGVRRRIEEILSLRLIDLQGINAIVSNLDMTTSVLQENIMQTRMQPISVVFSKFPRVVRDLARKLGKEIDLETVGQDVELDKAVVELLSDPLNHLVRNCADHGIESPQTRTAAGKPRRGRIVLRAFHEGGKVHIEISDDGAGIDPARIRAHALSKGIVTESQTADMSDRELQMLIFAPGFSTAAAVSEVSGRGVGMDVVKTNIERLGGAVEVESTVANGTRVILRLPLTLAIIPSLTVASSDRRFAIPQVALEEIVRIRAKDISRSIERVQGAEVLRLRGKLLPLVRLDALLELLPTFIHPQTGQRCVDRRARWSDRRGVPDEKSQTPEQEHQTGTSERRAAGSDRRQSVFNAVKVVVLKTEKRRFGLVVDEVRDTEEIVVKPLSGFLKNCVCYSGATIMGDGRVAMILDPNGIAELARLRFEAVAETLDERERSREKGESGKLDEILLFNIGTGERFGLPLASVARIEKHRVEEIAVVGEKEFLKYEDRSLRLVRLDSCLPVNPGARSDPFFVIVPKGSRSMGIVAGKVDDVVQAALRVDTQQVQGTGIAGTAMVNNHLVILVDIKQLFQAADPRLARAQQEEVA